MLQIRKNVFETNSSSSHSLHVEPGDLVEAPLPQNVLRSGVLTLEPGEYGWEWHRYYSMTDKANYLLTQFAPDTTKYGTEPAEIAKELRSEIPQLDMLFTALEELTGVSIEVKRFSGYVDHDSVGVGRSLFGNLHDLKSFLMSQSSYLETGNDNCSPPVRIDTDSGHSELYYPQNFVAIPKGAVAIDVVLREWYKLELVTVAGVVVDPDSELWRRTATEGVIANVSVTVPSNDRYSPFDYDDPRAVILKLLHDGCSENNDRLLPAKFTEDFSVSYRSNREKSGSASSGTERLLTLQLFVAPKLAKAYKKSS